MQKTILMAIILLSGCNHFNAQKHSIENLKNLDIEDITEYQNIDKNMIASNDDMQNTKKWYDCFQDSILSNLIEKGLNANISIKDAWLNLNNTLLAQKIFTNSTMPITNINLGGAYDLLQDNSFGIIGNLQTNWELDIWSRIKNQTLANNAIIESKEAIFAKTQLLLIGNISKIYFKLIEIKKLLSLTEEELRLQEKNLKLIQTYYYLHQKTILDLQKQKNEILKLKNTLNSLEYKYKSTQQDLAILIGENPQKWFVEIPDEITLQNYYINITSPQDLLEKNLDIKSKYKEFSAANYELAVEYANSLPQLSLQFIWQLSGNKTTNSLDTTMLGIGVNLIKNIFLDNQFKFKIKQADLNLENKLSHFKNTYLKTINEIEKTLLNINKSKNDLNNILEQIKISNDYLNSITAQYKNGKTNYLSVIYGKKTHIGLQKQMITYELGLKLAIIDLQMAMGHN